MQPQKRKVLHYVTAGKDLFGEWLQSLPDISGQAAIVKRIARVEEGNFGDHRALGRGVWELRIHYGPGYRVYYGEDGPIIVLLICGGDKGTQKRNIRKAQRLWTEWGRRK
ncbi:MAG: type II toxin-antitoxin system RelE/ParE family toxin [Elusimicrobia bacterium]|nr:type II toxin-antitoxin system RelE/ParE family toxin [Elusimicrobiota bacterium]